MSRIETAVKESRWKWPKLEQMKSRSNIKNHLEALESNYQRLRTRQERLRQEAEQVTKDMTAHLKRWELANAKLRAIDAKLMAKGAQ